VDERRRRLLELGAGLFTRFAYDELSMARIAKEAGISKALLYHYFPSKEAYFVATLEEKAAELARRTEPNPELPPLEQLSGSLDAYLQWVEENASSYEKMIRSASVPVNGWLWFMDGACLDWIEHRDMDREVLHGLLLGTLVGAVLAAGEGL
jgi:AcrR family transcriptional regulator